MSFAFEADGTSYLEDDADLEYTEDFIGDYENYHAEDKVLMEGVDPLDPTEAKPGSDDKVLMLAARYAAGLPLWHNSDCYDHGPGEIDIKGLTELA
ncbi:hypothetical protein MNBD_PLANCTO02-710 [hydrothermal vent metagenome]|uniref:Uncharacterized protein n=1 Tax=hydrothermal vent metagenome TaxID=652676 RepID=A0A3B1DSW2_9ZZZZ